ncbi:MAG: TIGR03790 family protein [Vicinamibacterales bacterium]
MTLRSILRAALVALVAASAPALAQAQSARNVLVVSNTRSSVSREIADYYAQKRSISSEQAVRIDVPVGDEVPREVYEARIERPIAEWLVSHSAQDRILYIVLTKDVPLRVAGTGGANGTVASVDSELALLYRKMAGQTIRAAGSVSNPFFAGDTPAASAPLFTHRTHDIYMVTRLDGYTVSDVRALIDRASAPAKQGVILLDGRSELVQSAGNNWLLKTSATLTKMAPWSDAVVLDTSAKVLRDTADVIGYYSWGSNDPAIKDRHLGNTFVPGAIGAEFVSTDARTFIEPPAEWTTNGTPYRGSHQSIIGDLIRDGITGVAGHVAEPYLNATIRPDILFPAYLWGFNLAESFYMAMPNLSWQTVVIGDPLCAPFRTRRAELTELEPPMDPVTELPAQLSDRRVALLVSGGAKKDAAQYLAKAEVRRGRRDAEGTMAALEKATTIDPSLISAHLMLALLHEERSEWDQAIDAYKRTLAAKPDDPTALNNLAYLMAVRKRDAANALPYAKRAYTAQNASPAATDTLAWVQHLLGNDVEALPLIVAASRQMPQNAEVRLHAAAIFAATGNTARAKDELTAAMTLDPSLENNPVLDPLRKSLGLSK